MSLFEELRLNEIVVGRDKGKQKSHHTQDPQQL
jgi:hypothetical protein